MARARADMRDGGVLMRAARHGVTRVRTERRTSTYTPARRRRSPPSDYDSVDTLMSFCR